MAPYPESGNLRTDTQQINSVGTWETTAEWSQYENISNMEVANGGIQLREVTYPPSESNDKLAYRWILGEGSGDTLAEIIQNENGTNNGLTWINSGDYMNGSALQATNGGEYLVTSTLNNWGSNLGSPHAIAFSMNVNAGSIGSPITLFGLTQGSQDFRFFINDYWGFLWTLTDPNNIRKRITGNSFTRDTNIRVVLNKPSNNPNDWEVWQSKSQKSFNVENNDGSYGSFVNFNYDLPFLGSNTDGSITNSIDQSIVIDDICLFNDSLTQNEINSYTYPWV